MVLKDRIELAEYFASLGFTSGAEIGVAEGRYSEILLQKIPGLKLYCIDSWIPYRGNWRTGAMQEGAYQEAVARLKRYSAKIIRKTSVEASLMIPDESLDFVFIDGAHDFDNVMVDIILWARKVKKEGIVSGHDYGFFTRSGIAEAVNKYTEIHHLELNIIPRNWEKETHRDDRTPVWWFHKK